MCDCYAHCELILCNGVTDRWRCTVCGREWEEPCNFDDDYS
jgi:hypothetical protein